MVRRLVPLLLALAACSLGAYRGAWWVPFPVGVAVGALGAAGRLGRGGVLAAMAGAVLGWALPLWALALSGQPSGATARAIAALAGLPPYAAVALAVTLLLAALQVLAGAWLARAAWPRRAPAADSAGAERPAPAGAERPAPAAGTGVDSAGEPAT